MHSPIRLRKAWSVVYKNGISSKSKITKKEIEEFSFSSDRHLARIATQLRNHKFKFLPSHGIAISKQNNPLKKRPIVVSPVENKIVQRAILDVVQEIPEIKVKLESQYNFGGVQDTAVPQAVHKAYKTALIKPFFIRTDIKAFFVNVPRPYALEIINIAIKDSEFCEILKQATNTELDNLIHLRDDKELFPLEDKGVAQGSCLSPMICNLLLHDFDVQMNQRGIICIRYIDDFILFANNEKAAFKAFKIAKDILEKLNLTVYDPRTDKEKAEMGISRLGFDFLGCSIREDRVRPAQKSQERLKERVTNILKNNLSILNKPRKAIEEGTTFRDAIYEVNNVIRGWGNSYGFCSDDNLMLNIDKDIDDKLQKFMLTYKAKLKKFDAKDKRRLLGVFLLEDCKKEDITKSSTLRYAVNQEKLNTKNAITISKI